MQSWRLFLLKFSSAASSSFQQNHKNVILWCILSWLFIINIITYLYYSSYNEIYQLSNELCHIYYSEHKGTPKLKQGRTILKAPLPPLWLLLGSPMLNQVWPPRSRSRFVKKLGRPPRSWSRFVKKLGRPPQSRSRLSPTFLANFLEKSG